VNRKILKIFNASSFLWGALNSRVHGVLTPSQMTGLCFILGYSAQEDDMNTDTDNWDAFQAALQWQPDPVEVDLLHLHRKERGTDIISMLVAIYGSKELFINEYRCRPSMCTLHILRLPRCRINSRCSSVRMYLLSHARCAP